MIPYEQMQPHQQRVVQEHTELTDRIDKLDIFTGATSVFNTLPDDERNRMMAQLHAMELYAFILQQRIDAFTASSNP